MVVQHAASATAHTEASTGAELPRFIKDEFDAFLEWGILTHGALRLRCGLLDRAGLTADEGDQGVQRTWTTPLDGKASLWPEEFAFGGTLFSTLCERAVPLDLRAVRELQHSALAMDCYSRLGTGSAAEIALHFRVSVKTVRSA